MIACAKNEILRSATLRCSNDKPMLLRSGMTTFKQNDNILRITF